MLARHEQALQLSVLDHMGKSTRQSALALGVSWSPSRGCRVPTTILSSRNPGGCSRCAIRVSTLRVAMRRRHRLQGQWLPAALGVRTRFGRFCWYWRLLSPVTSTSKLCPARSSSSPWSRPAHPSRGTVETECELSSGASCRGTDSSRRTHTGRNSLLGSLDQRDCLHARDTRIRVKELGQTVAGCQELEEDADGYASSPEYRSTTQDLGVGIASHEQRRASGDSRKIIPYTIAATAPGS